MNDEYNLIELKKMKKRESSNKYRLKNKEKIKQKRQEDSYKIKQSARHKEYRLKNKEKLSKKKNEYYANNKDKYLAYRKNYLMTHRYDKTFRLKSRADSKKRYGILKDQMFEILGKKCIKCGFDDIRALQFDHVNSDGHIDRKKLRANSFLRHYIKNKELALQNLQVLCSNCNQIKRLENNEFRKPTYDITDSKLRENYERIPEVKS